MDIKIYKEIFDASLQKVKSLRNPKSKLAEYNDYDWEEVLKQELFEFGWKSIRKYSYIIEGAKKISCESISTIIYNLQKTKHLFDSPKCSEELINNDEKVCFALQNRENKELLLFKQIEDDIFWKSKESEPKCVTNFMKTIDAPSCRYVYLMFDKAYLQIKGHNGDESDPGRGFNCYSIKWFFETYYGIEEYNRFCEALADYIKSVNEYLGFIVIRSLTPKAMLNFRKIVEKSIIKFRYEELLKEKIIISEDKYLYLPEEGFNTVRKQFINSRKYRVLFGNSDFSESITSAEWLYDSMKKAEAIDFSAVALGYFKTVEQLLFRLVCLHKDENRNIKCLFNLDNKEGNKDTENSELRAENVSKIKENITIGNMANFYKNNLDILRNDLDNKTKNYIKEYIFQYSKLRNGYSHKDNIKDISVVDKIRKETYQMLFLILGAQTLSDNDIEKLGAVKTEEDTDYQKLCEYINFHAGSLFVAQDEREKDRLFIGCRDPYSKVIDDRYVEYSGVYLKELSDNRKMYRCEQSTIPRVLYLGKIEFEPSEFIQIKGYTKIRKIFENDRFVGPSIVEEESFEY